MALLIFFFVTSIVFSFLCSIWEAVLLSVTPSYIQGQIEMGTEHGKTLQKYKENIDRPLAAILTLNTIAHTGGATGVGFQAGKIWTETPWATSIAAALMTLAVLVLSEIIPKTVGANFWRKLAPFTTRSIQIVIICLYSLVWFSQVITRNLKKEKNKSVLSRSDFAAMTQLAAKTGVFADGESKIMKNLMKFNSIQAQDIMTPRTVVVAAQEDISINQFYEENPKLRFSRIPIYDSSIDHIHGFFLKDDLLTSIIKNQGDGKLKTIKREILVVNENLLLLALFNTLMEKRTQIALVVDEFGGMAGIVTLEDLVETLLGTEIIDEFDSVEDMQVYARKKWEERAKRLGLLPAK